MASNHERLCLTSEESDIGEPRFDGKVQLEYDFRVPGSTVLD